MKIENLFLINFLKKVFSDLKMTDKCYRLLKDLKEISGFIYEAQYETFDQLEKLLKMESKLMMLLGLEIKKDIETRNPRYLLD